MAKTRPKPIDEQKQIAAELEVVMNEQKELEGKIANIDMRIERSKASCFTGRPSAVLDALRERIAMVPGLYLESSSRPARSSLSIKGNSPDEQVSRNLAAASNFRTAFLESEH